MLTFLRFGREYRVEMELEVRLYLQLGRLADLVQTFAAAEALITELNPDRSHYSLGDGRALDESEISGEELAPPGADLEFNSGPELPLRRVK